LGVVSPTKHARTGLRGCMKGGPTTTESTKTRDTDPGGVNSGCPQSPSRYATTWLELSSELTSCRQKEDFPAFLGPHTSAVISDRGAEDERESHKSSTTASRQVDQPPGVASASGAGDTSCW